MFQFQAQYLPSSPQRLHQHAFAGGPTEGVQAQNFGRRAGIFAEEVYGITMRTSTISADFITKTLASPACYSSLQNKVFIRDLRESRRGCGHKLRRRCRRQLEVEGHVTQAQRDRDNGLISNTNIHLHPHACLSNRLQRVQPISVRNHVFTDKAIPSAARARATVL